MRFNNKIMKPTTQLQLWIIGFVLVCLAAWAGHAQSIPLGWDKSPSPGVTNYVLYASTNAPLNVANAVTRICVGTNLTATVQDLQPDAKWLFAVTAQVGGLESDFSNVLTVQVPTAPKNMRTVILQYSNTLTNWQDVGFFKLRLP
jgi:hypothetical protein